MDSTVSALSSYAPDTSQDRMALQFPGEVQVLTSAGPRHQVDGLRSLLVSPGIHRGDTVDHAIGGCHSPELHIIMSLVPIQYGAQSLPLHSAAYTREVMGQHLSHHDTKLLLIGPGESNPTVAQAAANAPAGVPHAIVSRDLSSCRVDISVPSTPGLLGRPAAAAPSGGAITEVVNRASAPRFQNYLFLENLTSTIPAGSVAASVHGASAGRGSPGATSGAAWRPVTGGGRTFGESGGGSVAAPQSEPPHTKAAVVRAEASGLKLKHVLLIAAGALTAVKGHAPLFFFYVALVFFSISEVFKIKLGRFHGFLKSAGTFLIFCGFATHVITTLTPAFRYTAMAITFAAVAVVLAMFVPLRPLRGTLRDPRPPPSTALDAHLSEQSGSPGGIDAMV